MATDSVIVDNPYGLQALWAQGDFIAKFVLILLAFMSAYSWFIIFTKWWEQRRLLKQAAEAEKNFWAADNIRNGVTKLTGKGNIFKAIASEAIDAAGHHDTRMTQQVPLHEWIDNVLARAVARIGSALADAAAVPRHHGLDGAVHRPVRHGVGHLPRAGRDRRGRPGLASTRSPVRSARR
jgi:biopolymer transport protein ExbB